MEEKEISTVEEPEVSSDDVVTSDNKPDVKSEEVVNEVSNVQTEFEKVEPKYDEVEVKKVVKPVRTDSYFDGKLLELFGWTLLKNLITVITLGIAAPWGECMMLDFEISHTVLNGKRLKFKGTGGSLFVERFKWVFLTLITFGIYGFWIPIKKNKWILSNIYFEDEGAVAGESYFDGKLIQLIGVNILCNFLNIISLGILFPFTQCFRLRWLAKHSIINRKRIVFDGKAISLFGHYLLWLFLTVITFGIYGFWLSIKMTKWEVKNSHIKLSGEVIKKDNSFLILAILFVLFLIGLVSLISANPFEINEDFFDGFGPSMNRPAVEDPLYDSSMYNSTYDLNY